jgi:Predicted Zn-dependent peptidases
MFASCWVPKHRVPCRPQPCRPQARRVRFALLGLALLLLGRGTPVWGAPPIQHWQTSNGAQVFFVSAHELPIVDLCVVLDAASARDGNHPGLARLTNSLLSEGAAGLTGVKLAERFEGIGAQFSVETLRDMAAVTLRTLSDAAMLEEAVATLKLIVTQPDFDEQSFHRNINLMRVALRRKAQSPEDLAMRAFYSAVYADHPYASPPEGTEESLDRISRADVLAFYKRYYVARNAVVAIVGALNRAEAERVAETVLGALPAGEATPPLPPVKALEGPHTITIPFPSAQTHIYLGQPGMTRTDQNYFPLYVGNHILGGSGLVSRLHKEIRERRGLSYSVYSHLLPMEKEGPFIMGLQTRNDQARDALRLMRETLSTYLAQGPSDEELGAAKQNLSGGFALRLDSNEKILDYLVVIGYYGLPLNFLETYVPNVEAVTRAMVADAFRERIHPDRSVTVLVGSGAQADKPLSGFAEGHPGT